MRRLNFQVNERGTFEEFIDLGVINDIRAVTTEAYFSKRLRKGNVVGELFDLFESYLQIKD